MKKILLKLIPLFAALLCTVQIFTACANNELAVTVSDSGGTIAYKYYADKEIVDERFSSNLPNGLKNCDIDEINGRIYYVHEESFEASDFTELQDKLCRISLYGEESMNAFSSAAITARSLTLTVNPCVTEDVKDIALIQEVNLEDIAILSLTVTMPYEIEEYSEGTLSEDKKTLTLELSSFDSEKQIEVNCVNDEKTPKKFPWKILLIIGGIILTLAVIGAIIYGIVFLIKRRSRKEAEAMPDTPIDLI